ncbi:uncharacterized protein RSE6_05642 [Rhynchosporium secalis]|uniref:Uncharacterized protein n=1 Tax=Rhynchosporium secalis TaxID=38038 RepID=A0A1E1M8B5_RHYSE|nr:uncharacterized protein RSE6_05642 [Rhynchosporium secalis]
MPLSDGSKNGSGLKNLTEFKKKKKKKKEKESLDLDMKYRRLL